MTSRLKWALLIVATVIAAAASLYGVRGQLPLVAAIQSHALIQEAKPDAILEYIRAQKSPVVLINFWASWCEPCKEEFPFIMNLKRNLADKGLRVVFVSVDDPADVEAAEAFLKLQQVDFPTFYKGSQSLSFVTHIYPQWTGAVPTSVLIGPDLKILEAWEGDTTQAEFEHRIEKYLKGT